ncbi:MAG: hypothetical protein LWX07_10510 [Bacteroidetes bacterium]|nr:hypothetical protein [Bacteroidota bacterium]
MALIFCGSASAQKDVCTFKSDTLKTGKYYVILTNEGTEQIGKLTGCTDSSLTIIFENDYETIMKSEITAIRNRVAKDWKYDKGIFSSEADRIYFLGTGVSFPVDESRHYTTMYAKGFELSAAVIFASNRNVGIMAELDFHHLARKDDNSATFSAKGGSINSLSLRINFLAGDFKMKDVNYFFFTGPGIGISFKGSRSENYLNSNYNYTTSGTADLFVTGKAGLNVNFKVAEKIRMFTEAQFNLIIGENNPNYFALKAGFVL